MYHLKRSFGCCGWPSGCCSAGCSSSSAILLSCSTITPPALLRAKAVQYLFHNLAEEGIDHKEEQSEEEYRNDHHGGRRLHFLAARCDHLAHLGAHIAQKVGQLSPGARQVTCEGRDRAGFPLLQLPRPFIVHH